MSKCVFAGCFDPFTIGHLDVVNRLSKIFDEVCVVVSKNAEKNLVLNGEERLKLVSESINLNNVKVVLHEGLLVDFCKTYGADCIAKGVRNTVDFEYETMHSTVNKKLGEVETLFLPCSQDKSFISSSFVKELLSLGRDASEYLPRQIADEVQNVYSKKLKDNQKSK